MSIMNIVSRWQRNGQLKRLAVVKDRLYPYESYGTGPYGTSNPELRKDQLELMELQLDLEAGIIPVPIRIGGRLSWQQMLYNITRR